MSKTTVLLVIIIALLSMKYVLLLLAVFTQWGENRHRKGKKGLFTWVAHRIYRIDFKLCMLGYERWALYHFGYIPSVHLRRLIYKLVGVKMGKRVIFHFKTELRDPYKLVLGDGCIIGDNAILDARCGLTLGRNVNLSSNVSIYTLQHDHRSPDFAGSHTMGIKQSVEIGDRVWLGSNVIVLPGVTIGEGAVCCAGCVVTKDVEPYAVVAGIPAKKVNERPRCLTYEFDGKTCSFY
ncbi:MAG: acyltransferase [Bacteroidaceae bacterium]|nr:acyltransferase [Bacteroidaceae bacterium]